MIYLLGLSVGMVVLALSSYSTRRFGSMLLLCVVLGVGIVTGTKWSINILSPKIMIVKTLGFAPMIGKLTLTARAISDVEVVLNLTFNALHSEPDWKFRVDIRKGPTSPGLGVGVLPDGLELVSGDLVWEGYNNVSWVSVEARARAVMDGEWGVQGWAVRWEGTWDNYGALDALSSGALTIIVSNGTITDITTWTA